MNERGENEYKQHYKVELTPEKLERIMQLNEELRKGFGVLSIFGNRMGFSEYTGIDEAIGKSTYQNTEAAACQLLFILALSEHPLVKKAATEVGGLQAHEIEDLHVKPLVEARVCQSMKVLDLGCGPVPSFARCARALGAEVYTIDVLDKADFLYGFNGDHPGYQPGDESCFSPEALTVEQANHLQLDLSKEGALEEIKKTTGGNFDVLTEGIAVSVSVPRFAGKNFLPLLHKGGVYFRENFTSSAGHIIVKD